MTAPPEDSSIPGETIPLETPRTGDPSTAPPNLAPGDSKESGRPHELLLHGIISRITFRNEESGFAVLRAELDESSGSPVAKHPFGMSASAPAGPVVVGVLPGSCSVGSHFVARGEWQTHARFGRQFRAFSITETEPTGVDAIRKYLGSGAVKGFGPKLAERIVEKFGVNALQVLDQEPDRLLEVSGIGRRKLVEITTAWAEKRNMRAVLLFFQQYGVPLHLAQRIYNAYGDRSIERVRENPYLLARDVWGIGFTTADTVARALGIGQNSLARITAGMEHVLKRGADDGHCFLPNELLLQKAAHLLEIDDAELLTTALSEAVRDLAIVSDHGRSYLPLLAQAEADVARALHERIVDSEDLLDPIAPHIIDQAMASSPQGHSAGGSLRLSPQQQEAVRFAASKRLLVITGGPGCGKTTVVRALTQMMLRAGLNVRLAAPTGRAAQRLAEVCSLPASTIHRLLKYDPSERKFVHDAENLLDLDVLVVDESSMIDITLAAGLLDAIPPRARLIFVGDADQLPSVGPGLFLADLLALPDVARVRLTTLFRRAEESLITRIAHEVNAGVIPTIPAPDGQTRSDAYFLRADTAEEAGALIERLVVDQIPKRFQFRGSEIMVLSPMNQGELGVIALNRRLQRQLVPEREGLPVLGVGELRFRIGDRVCQRVNNYQLSAAGVFNGDQGEIIGIDTEERKLIVRLWDGREVTYPSDSLSQLDLAYAITIHRSQGAEVPVVVLVLHESHTVLLERQLLYTAITRAKKLLILVGTKRALALATKKSRSQRRYTALSDRVRELASGPRTGSDAYQDGDEL